MKAKRDPFPRTRRPGLGAAIFALLLAGPAGAAGDAAKVGWPELSRADANAVQAGSLIELAGYLLPVDQEGELVYAFLLVSAPGACSHDRQPPPDQIVLVYPAKPYRLTAIYEPVMISGVLEGGETKTQLYIRDGVAEISSSYEMGRATVVAAEEPPAAPVGASRNPWQAITR